MDDGLDTCKTSHSPSTRPANNNKNYIDEALIVIK